MSIWGFHTILDLKNCNSVLIKSPYKLKVFINKLVRLIEMKPYGKAQIKRFGKDTLEGYTIIQPIETSCITCHFDEVDNRAFIDIFSCKEYNNKLAVEFCKNYFKAEITQARFLNRK